MDLERCGHSGVHRAGGVALGVLSDEVRARARSSHGAPLAYGLGAEA